MRMRADTRPSQPVSSRSSRSTPSLNDSSRSRKPPGSPHLSPSERCGARRTSSSAPSLSTIAWTTTWRREDREPLSNVHSIIWREPSFWREILEAWHDLARQELQRVAPRFRILRIVEAEEQQRAEAAHLVVDRLQPLGHGG